MEDLEIIYTWEMDLNRSLLSSETVLVPKSTLSPTPVEFMHIWVHGSWLCVYASMLCVAIGGNAIVIWIVTAHRRMRSVTNYFLVNLSLADLMMSSLNCLFNFIYMLHRDWMFGSRYCQLNNFVANVTVAASVFTLTGISFDRYQAIVLPMKPRMSKTYALVMIAGIWFCGMLLALPCLLYSSTFEYKYKGQPKTACILHWPDGLPNVSQMDFIYQIVFFVATYLAPMIGMIFFYSAMGKVLWGSRSIGELTQRQIDSIRSKRKVVRMFILVIAIFGVCWFPYQSYFIYTHLDPGVLYSSYIQHLFLGFYWLAMANAMVNPIIYYWMNARFRTYFKTAICGWRSLFRPRNQSSVIESPLPDRQSQSGSRSRSGLDSEYDSNQRAIYARRWPTTTTVPCPGLAKTASPPTATGRPPSSISSSDDCRRIQISERYCVHRVYYDAANFDYSCSTSGEIGAAVNLFCPYNTLDDVTIKAAPRF